VDVKMLKKTIPFWLRSSMFLATVSGVALAVAQPAVGAGLVEPGETTQFDQADRCEGTPPAMTPTRTTSSSCDPMASRAEASATVSAQAVDEEASSFSSVITDFTVTGGGDTALDAVVFAGVEWDGVLFGSLAPGSEATVKVEMLLVDETTGIVTGRTQVVAASQSDDTTDRIGGSEDVAFQGTVVRGHDHSIQLEVTCEADAGSGGGEVGCAFETGRFGDGFARWTSLAITVEEDLAGLLEQLLAGQAQLMAEHMELEAGHARLEQGQSELLAGQAALLLGQTELKAGQAELEEGQEDLKAGQARLEAGQAELKAGQTELKAGQAELKAGQEELMEGQARLEAGQAEIIRLLLTPQGRRSARGQSFPIGVGNGRR
jgi:hypothetical protein